MSFIFLVNYVSMWHSCAGQSLTLNERCSMNVQIKMLAKISKK